MEAVDKPYYASLPLTSESGANKMERINNKLTPIKLCLDLLQLEGVSEEQRSQLLKDNLPIAQNSMQHILAILSTIKC
jgi:hypothetical protein